MRRALPVLVILGVFAAATCQLSARSQAQPLPGQDSQQASAGPQSGTISGTVVDVNQDPIPGASVVLQGPNPGDRRMAVTDTNGFYEFRRVPPGRPFHVIVTTEGFHAWTSPVVMLSPGQNRIVTGSTLQLAMQTSVTVTPATNKMVAIQQIHAEERQRVLGIVPNFFEVFTHNPAPLSPKLKFALSFKVVTDPFTMASMLILAAPLEVQNSPGYADDWQGFAERVGTSYANQFTDIMIGGAILPTLLHQDPRYYYQGTGSVWSRVFHALSNPFITMGDNGHLQPNFSSLGGDLASAAISDTYYPGPNRGTGLILQDFATNIGVHMAIRLLQEFAFHPVR